MSSKRKPPAYPSQLLPRIFARVSKKAERRIRELALKEDSTTQALLVEGLALVFKKRGLPAFDENEK